MMMNKTLKDLGDFYITGDKVFVRSVKLLELIKSQEAYLPSPELLQAPVTPSSPQYSTA